MMFKNEHTTHINSLLNQSKLIFSRASVNKFPHSPDDFIKNCFHLFVYRIWRSVAVVIISEAIQRLVKEVLSVTNLRSLLVY